jgi:hypothetical protein
MSSPIPGDSPKSLVHRTLRRSSRRFSPMGSNRSSRVQSTPPVGSGKSLEEVADLGMSHFFYDTFQVANTEPLEGAQNPLGEIGTGRSQGANERFSSGSSYVESSPLISGTCTFVFERNHSEILIAPVGLPQLNEPEQPECTEHKATLKALRTTVERQKRQLRTKVNSLMRTREELEQSKQQYSEIERELEEMQEELISLCKNEKQYRNWWLNEVQFTKLLLNRFPEPNCNIELVRRSQAHYLGHY